MPARYRRPGLPRQRGEEAALAQAVSVAVVHDVLGTGRTGARALLGVEHGLHRRRLRVGVDAEQRRVVIDGRGQYLAVIHLGVLADDLDGKFTVRAEAAHRLRHRPQVALGHLRPLAQLPTCAADAAGDEPDLHLADVERLAVAALLHIEGGRYVHRDAVDRP